MGVITKPSSVQRSGIVRLQVACGMAAGGGGAHSQRLPRGAVYRRHSLLPRAQHALLLTQTVHKKRGVVRQQRNSATGHPWSDAWRSRWTMSGGSPSPGYACWGFRSFGAKNNDPLEVFVFTWRFERLFWRGRSVGHKPQRWGRKPWSRAKYHTKRGQNQGFSSTICVGEDLRFSPQLDGKRADRCCLYACYGNPQTKNGFLLGNLGGGR